MQASDLPSRFNIPFADAAGPSYIRTVPEASQIGIQDGAASLTDGFPPDCFTPVTSGGTPPFGQDFNGLFNQITKWNQWQAAGGPIKYNAAFSSAIGGYPQGATVMSATTVGLFWLSTADNNTTDPDAGGANWRAFSPGASGAYGVAGGTGDALTLTLSPAIPSYYDGLQLVIKAAAANTGAATINVNGKGAKSIVNYDGTTLLANEIIAGMALDLVYDASGSRFIYRNAPYAPTAATSNDSQLVATTAFVKAAIASQEGGRYAMASGTNTLTAALSPAPTSYAAGLAVDLDIVNANTGAVTLNLNTLGAKNVVNYDGAALVAGELQAGMIARLVYDGTQFVYSNASYGPTPTLGANNQQLATMAALQAALVASAAYQYFAATSTTPFTAFTFNAVDTTGAPVTKPLPPSPSTGDFLTFVDIGKVWQTNNFTLGRNGHTIMGLSEDLVCNVSNLQFSIWWNGTTWVLF